MEKRGGGGAVHCPQLRHRAEQLFRIGALVVMEDLFDRSGSDRFRLPHDELPIGDLSHHSHVVGDEEDAGVEVVLEFTKQRQNLRLDRHVQCSGRFVGDEDFRLTGQRHGDDRVLTHATGHLVKVLSGAARRLGDAHPLHELDDTLLRLSTGLALVHAQHFRQQIAHRVDRIERCQRLRQRHSGSLPSRSRAPHGAVTIA